MPESKMTITADYLTLAKVLQRTTQNYIVPLFQRRYSWSAEEQCATLWKDVQRAVEKDKIHFMGALVLQQKEPKHGLDRQLIIDGQQRLTTFTLLIAALRDKLDKLQKNSRLSAKIEEMLVCPNYKEDGYPIEGISDAKDGYFRIHPSEKDQKDYYKIILGKANEADHDSKIYRAYKFFYDNLKNFDVERIEEYYFKLCQNIGLAVIQLQNADNPYEVFSSLNQKGLKLTVADLIRNHLFEQIPEEEQKKYYNEYFSRFETNFEELRKKINEIKAKAKQQKATIGIKDYNEETPTQFIYHLWTSEKGKIVPTRNLIQEVEDEIKGKEEAAEFLNKLKVYSDFYRRFVLPDFEPNLQVRTALENLVRLGEATFYPLLLKLFYARAEGKIDDETLIEMMEVVENVLVRRKLHGREAEGVNREFPRIA
ncbi:MAG: DUF262 domain-containing protein, partial [Bacteroidia bacterium]|nr:DUF262 domain-containing protein [Bacteroidia bacterium]